MVPSVASGHVWIIIAITCGERGVHVVVSEWMHVGQAGQGLPLGIYVYGRTGKGARVGP